MNTNPTPADGQMGGLPESHCSARDKAWMEIPPLLRGCTDYADFSEGWKAAFRAIRDRLPAPEFLDGPLTPREVQHLVRFVEEQISPDRHADRTPFH